MRLEERDGASGVATASGASDAVHVPRFLVRVWQVVDDHQIEVLDVEAARADIGRHDDVDLAALVLLPRLHALLLVAVPEVVEVSTTLALS